jgi:Ran GTPase-activating protein (RanGAP) involved in mRNA processing and transport
MESRRKNSTLQEIDLSNNNIADEGAKWIAEAIKVNSALLKISISQDNIGPEGLKWMADAIKVLWTLHRRLASLAMALEMKEPSGWLMRSR